MRYDIKVRGEKVKRTATGFTLCGHTHHMSQRHALAQLYDLAGGAQWRSRQHWLHAPVCKWHGILCDKGGVSSIDLGGNGVEGTLPTQLCLLSKLRVLNIDESRLSGTLPSCLSTLTALSTILFASNSGLSGTLPANLAALRALSELDLSRTRISGTLSQGVAALGRLQRLQLDHMAFSGTLPKEIGQMTRVEALFVHESRLLSGTLPTQVGRLAGSLSIGMSLAGTRISGVIPTELARASRLRALWLVHTRLSGTLPTQMGGMRLAELELHANRLSGTLPTQLGGALSGTLRRCVLTAAQGPFQAHHSMRPVDRPQSDTNRFFCPLPTALPPPCVPHLVCVDGIPGGVAHGRTRELEVLERLERERRGGRGGRVRGRGSRAAREASHRAIHGRGAGTA